MIPLVDISILAKFKTLFPQATVVWSPDELTKKALTVADNERSINYTGISVFRTTVLLDETRANAPMAHRGQPNRYNDARTLVDCEGRIYVVAEYAISIYSNHLSKINDIQRELSFSTYYDYVHVVHNNQTYEFPVEVTDPSFTATSEDKTEKIKEYYLSMSMKVKTYWVKSHPTRTVLLQYINTYDRMSEGVPLGLPEAQSIVGYQPNP